MNRCPFKDAYHVRPNIRELNVKHLTESLFGNGCCLNVKSESRSLNIVSPGYNFPMLLSLLL